MEDSHLTTRYSFSDLLLAVPAGRRQFEASPFDRWVRLEGGGTVVYVVRDAWGDGCSLLAISGRMRQVTHFLHPPDAVAVATGLIRGKRPAKTAGPDDSLSA